MTAVMSIFNKRRFYSILFNSISDCSPGFAGNYQLANICEIKMSYTRVDSLPRYCLMYNAATVVKSNCLILCSAALISHKAPVGGRVRHQKSSKSSSILNDRSEREEQYSSLWENTLFLMAFGVIFHVRHLRWRTLRPQ